MATAYLASTDFPRNRSVMERPITISLPSSLTNNTTPPLPSTDSYRNSVTRIVEAIRPSSMASIAPSTEPPVSSSAIPSTLPSTVSNPITPEPTRSDNSVLSLIRGSMNTIERVASSIAPRPAASTTAPTSSSTTTPSLPSPTLSTTPSAPRGLSVAEPAPAALRASPVFAGGESSTVTPPLTQTLIDLYPTSPTDAALAPDLLMLEEPLIAEVYYPDGLTTPAPDLATIMEQDPLILWA